jgi:hypothetical protein
MRARIRSKHLSVAEIAGNAKGGDFRAAQENFEGISHAETLGSQRKFIILPTWNNHAPGIWWESQPSEDSIESFGCLKALPFNTVGKAIFLSAALSARSTGSGSGRGNGSFDLP